MKVTIKRGSYTRREGGKGRVRYARGATLDMSEAEIEAYGESRLLLGGAVVMPMKPLAAPEAPADDAADKAKADAARTLLDKADDTPAVEFRNEAGALLGENFDTKKAAVEALEAVARPTE